MCKRVRVSLTIDRGVWERMQAAQEELLSVSASRVAERAFLSYLALVDGLTDGTINYSKAMLQIRDLCR